MRSHLPVPSQPPLFQRPATSSFSSNLRRIALFARRVAYVAIKSIIGSGFATTTYVPRRAATSVYELQINSPSRRRRNEATHVHYIFPAISSAWKISRSSSFGIGFAFILHFVTRSFYTGKSNNLYGRKHSSERSLAFKFGSNGIKLKTSYRNFSLPTAELFVWYPDNRKFSYGFVFLKASTYSRNFRNMHDRHDHLLKMNLLPCGETGKSLLRETFREKLSTSDVYIDYRNWHLHVFHDKHECRYRYRR